MVPIIRSRAATICCAAVFLAGFATSACGDADAGSQSRPAAGSSSTVALPSSQAISAELAAAGVNETVTQLLYMAAIRTDYAAAGGTALSRQAIEALAYTKLMDCRAVTTGAQTWETILTREIAAGVTVENATELNTFLRTQFCPQVR